MDDDGSGDPATGLDADAVLLDMDGTLVDSTPLVESLWGRFAARHGVAVADVFAYSHGRQTGDTVRRFVPPGVDADAVTAAFQAEELERFDGIAEVPGARRLLDVLRGARVAVVTSAPRELAARRLAAAGLVVPPVLVGAEDTPAGKPDPSSFLVAAAALGVEPSRCLVLEDSEAGVRAAVASGARVLVVGPHPPASAAGLPHVPDLRGVRVTVSPDGRQVAVRWPSPSGARSAAPPPAREEGPHVAVP